MINSLNILIYTLFILAISRMSATRTAYKGNIFAIFGMIIALIFGLMNLKSEYQIYAATSILLGGIVGIIGSQKTSMSQLPQMVALLNGFGGLASGLIGISETINIPHPNFLQIFIIFIGCLTFSGSVAGFFKLSGLIKINDTSTFRSTSSILLILSIIGSFYAHNGETEYIIGFALLSSLLGFCFILPIGGADMPIVISTLNGLSGWCTTLVGFNLQNNLLIIVGTLIGASGSILTYIMTKAMNRHLIQVLFAPKTINKSAAIQHTEQDIHKGTPQDAAFLMENAHKVIIVPGFGMAASGAQHELGNMANILIKKYKVEVKFGIHPVAGRMPGHMNVLLAEADIPPEIIYGISEINSEFKTADVVYVIGANDTTNPLSKTQKDSTIYQMPILEVEQAKRILFVKRSLAPGYAGLDNPLFYEEKTLMLLGDGKEITKEIVTQLENDIN